nr:hypothetical protein CFP56_01641 [Quercus suber]
MPTTISRSFFFFNFFKSNNNEKPLENQDDPRNEPSKPKGRELSEEEEEELRAMEAVVEKQEEFGLECVKVIETMKETLVLMDEYIEGRDEVQRNVEKAVEWLRAFHDDGSKTGSP